MFISGPPSSNEGFLEYYNHTTMQWVPICDERFTERNAEVVCRELGFDSLNVYLDRGIRVEYHPNSLTRIWSWPEPLQCRGDELRLEDCPIRLNGQLYGHRHKCEWDRKFVFIHCGERNLPTGRDYWGGIRFADGEFEQNLYEHRIHDVVTHETTHRVESIIEHVNVTGAGILHNEKSPAVLSVSRSPTISNMNITMSASDGINLISPLENTQLLFNSIETGGQNERKLFRTKGPSLSVKLFATGASNVHGFIAEVVTLPISAIGFNRDVQHNISYSVLEDNRQGAIKYASAGEVNPIVTMEWNQFNKNCKKLYGNFTTCQAAIDMDIQNTQSVYFRVVSNFSYNYVQENYGYHILEVSGFEKVRLPIYQSTSHNGFYGNYALEREARGTIVAGTAGQQFVDNVFFNPYNDYEIVTVNRSLSHDVWKTPIDAKHNWWGYNETLAVMGRIRDHSDDLDLLELDFRPFHMNNKSILSGKCPPAWSQVGDTCYIYVGAPMAFEEARSFCRSVNASMPYVMSNYLALYQFLRHPKVLIDPLSWRDDIVTVAVLGTVGAALLLVALAAGFWYSKSRHRHLERLERRNSIRQSLHSIRSVGLASSHGGFADIGRRKPTSSQRSSPTLVKGSDYKKMMNGSIDSMDKSQFNSSVEDNHSYDIYEAHNPNASTQNFNGYSANFPTAKPANEALNPSFDLAYRNEGFRDTSTFSSRDNWQPSTNVSEYNDENAANQEYLHNSSTLPLDTSLATTDSTFDMKPEFDYGSQEGYQPQRAGYREPPEPPLPLDDSFQAEGEYPLLPPAPPKQYNYGYDPGRANLLETNIDSEPERPKSQNLLETNFDDDQPAPVRSKSEALLETNLDEYAPNQGIPAFNRSKSQPLETAM
ncbi:hypothetical protein C0J52_05036 [Blattella germanica]|nr:hypothetical protein C0J52_05036 [Blattella germanica]